RLDRLVLMGPGGCGRSSHVPMPPEGIKLLYALFREPSMEALRKMIDVFVFDRSKITDELIEARFENMMRNNAIHLKNHVISQGKGGNLVDLSPRFPEIKAKTLCTWGRDDRFVPLDLGLKVLWGIPQADLHIFSECGH